MYPKLRPDVYIAPADDGAYVTVDGKRTHLKGKHLLVLLERLMPFLDGNHSLEDLTARLPADKRTFVLNLINLLVQVAALRDAAEDRQHRPDEATARTYAVSLSYLETLAEGANRRFLQVRNARVVLLGGGAAARILATALCEAGVSQGTAMLPEGDPHAPVLRAALAGHAQVDPQVAWELREFSGPLQGQVRDVLEGCTLAIGVGTAEELTGIQAHCLELGVPLLPVMQAQGFGTAGPLVRPGQAGCVRCARSRIQFPGPGEPSASQAWGFLGARAAVEAFKLLAGLPSDCEQGIVRIENETLTDARYPLQAVGNCPACARPVPRLELHLEPQERDGLALPEGISAWINPFSGLLASVDAEDWPQLPACLWAARGREGSLILVPGKDHGSAKARCVLSGVSGVLPKQPPEDAAYAVLGSTAELEFSALERAPQDMVWCRSAGVSAAEWVGQGLIAQACRELSPEQGGQRLTAAELGAAMDEETSFWWKTLSLRYDLEVEAWMAGHPRLPVKGVWLMTGPECLASAGGRSPAEALKTAVLAALGTVQAREDRKQDASFSLTPPGVALRVEPSTQESLSWTGWLRQFGNAPVYLAQDSSNPSLTALGVYLGWIGMKPGM
ncbi:MAG TPA: hypothetical protein VNA24_22420 [Hyalangium sp.]|jgi:hypothetical protein|nr:hypothetical protein [Hyalangium sp.]